MSGFSPPENTEEGKASYWLREEVFFFVSKPLVPFFDTEWTWKYADISLSTEACLIP